MNPGRWIFRPRRLLCLASISKSTVPQRWRCKACIPDNHQGAKLVFAFCLFMTSGYIVISIMLGPTPQPTLLPDSPQDRMQGIALHPELRVEQRDNFKIWPYEVTNLNYNVQLMPTNPCEGDTFLVLFVHTRPHFLHSRRVIRDTWGSVARTRNWPGSKVKLPRVEIYFVTAQSQAMPSVEENLRVENEQYNDILMFNFTDSYFNVTLKSLLELRWFSDYCSHAQFMGKADDDVFVDIKHLVDLLQDRKYKSNTIVGDMIWNPKVLRDHPKWAVPYHRFRERLYPNYMKGTTYVMTSDLPQKLVSIAPFVLPIHIDDVFVTGILAHILDVNHVKSSSFRVIESMAPDPCLVLYLRKIVTLGTANPLHIKHLEEKESHMFQYVLWRHLTDDQASWHCSLWGLYWSLCNLIRQ